MVPQLRSGRNTSNPAAGEGEISPGHPPVPLAAELPTRLDSMQHPSEELHARTGGSPSAPTTDSRESVEDRLAGMEQLLSQILRERESAQPANFEFVRYDKYSIDTPPALHADSSYMGFKRKLQCWAARHEHVPPPILAQRVLEFSFPGGQPERMVNAGFANGALRANSVTDILAYLDPLLADTEASNTALYTLKTMRQGEHESIPAFSTRYMEALYAADILHNLDTRLYRQALRPEIQSNLLGNHRLETNLQLLIAAAAEIETSIRAAHRSYGQFRHRRPPALPPPAAHHSAAAAPPAPYSVPPPDRRAARNGAANPVAKPLAPTVAAVLPPDCHERAL